MPSTVALPHSADRHPHLTYEHHPNFGDYIYSPTILSWTQCRAFADGHPLLLSGRGRRPTEDQIALFWAIDSRLDELTKAAIAAVCPPPIKPRRGLFSRTLEFARAELVLREVGLDEVDSFVLFFDTPMGDKINMWPMVTFCDWRITKSEWVC